MRICDVPKSTYYYRLKHPAPLKPKGKGRPIPGFSHNQLNKLVPDQKIKAYITRILSGDDAAFGYRKITVILKRKYKLIINKKKVYRLCKEMNLLAPQREKRNLAPKKVANNRIVTGPNQLWQMDIKYGYVAGQRRHFYLASIIDVFDRAIVSYHRGKACHTQDILQVLQKGLQKRKVSKQEHKLVIRTDNGTQFTSKAFYAFCEEAQIEHERIPVQMPNKNAYIESFHSILERECYLRNCFESFTEAFNEVDRFIHYYNHRRIHGSLMDWPPTTYTRLVAKGEITPQKIAL